MPPVHPDQAVPQPSALFRSVGYELIGRRLLSDVDDYGRWLTKSRIPKLFINAEPGSILTGAARDFCRTWSNQKEIAVKGIHFIQEESPHEIGNAVADFAQSVGDGTFAGD